MLCTCKKRLSHTVLDDCSRLKHGFHEEEGDPEALNRKARSKVNLGNEEDYPKELIELVCGIVGEKLQATAETAFQREMNRVVAQLKETFAARISALESTLGDIVDGLELQENKFEEKLPIFTPELTVLNKILTVVERRRI